MDLTFELKPVQQLFRVLLEPAAPFTWFGLPFSTLDAVAAVRLVTIIRQLRDLIAREELKKPATRRPAWDAPSFFRDFAPVLTVLCGGEAANGL
jgi:hypothetical protein